jgi:predicted DNA-binding protein
MKKQKMVRVSVTLTEDLDEFLKTHSEIERCSKAYVVRKAIDEFRKKQKGYV